VEAEDLIVNERGEGEVVEEIGEVFPNVGIAVFSETLVVEAIYLSDLTGFMITTENCDALGVSDFESNQESNSFDRVVSSINVITLRYN
jgi:hypothetical protein